MKRTIAIVAGGDSNELQVSLRSADGINSFLSDEKYNKFIVTIVGTEWNVVMADGRMVPVDRNDFSFVDGGEKVKFDFAYITIHGTPGENGILQGYFRLLRVPFSGCDVLASALTFDKWACNHFLKGVGPKVAGSILLRRGDAVESAEVVEKVGLPCFVKPNVGGSSFGVTKVKTEADVQGAIAKAFAEAEEVLIEAFMEGVELTCGMYRVGGRSVVFPVTEVVTDNEFFDYDAKYNGQVDEITPARISSELTKLVQDTTEKIYRFINARGIIRVDYIVSPDGELNLLEVNTTPGMTATSFIPQQVRAAGMDIVDVLDEIIDDAISDK